MRLYGADGTLVRQRPDSEGLDRNVASVESVYFGMTKPKHFSFTASIEVVNLADASSGRIGAPLSTVDKPVGR